MHGTASHLVLVYLYLLEFDQLTSTSCKASNNIFNHQKTFKQCSVKLVSPMISTVKFSTSIKSSCLSQQNPRERQRTNSKIKSNYTYSKESNILLFPRHRIQLKALKPLYCNSQTSPSFQIIKSITFSIRFTKKKRGQNGRINFSFTSVIMTVLTKTKSIYLT